jgi:2-iminobutanoate/2-iminopropanoate deaminase
MKRSEALTNAAVTTSDTSQPSAPARGASLSQVAIASAGTSLMFVSGVTSRDADGDVLDGDIVEQTHRVFQRLRSIIESAGAQMNDIVKLTTFVRDADDLRTIGVIRKGYVGDPPPAATSVEVSRLFDSRHLIEVEAVVAVRTAAQRPSPAAAHRAPPERTN